MEPDSELLEIVAGFVPEAAELCAKISRDLMSLEEKPGSAAPAPDVYKSLARGLHTLKGTSATLGLDDLMSVGHAMEDVVAPLHKLLRPIPSNVADGLLRTLDMFQNRLKAHAEARSSELTEATLIIEQLEGLSSAEASPTTAAASVVQGPPPSEPGSDLSASLDEQGSWRVNGRDIVSLFRDVERTREMRLRMGEHKRLTDAALAVVTKLTTVPALYEQLVALHRALQADGEEISEIVDSLEHGIKTICTLPLRTIMEPLHRSVRDFCRSTGKQAGLSIVGGELSIDRRILERLKGPLVHLIRNALDHGIEPVAIRAERGKHRAGALVIRVEQQGNMVFVEVSDDGGGIDCERIREVARARSLFSSEELAQMSASQLMRLIFHPGFSTRAEVTDTSGRGVGMDVVLSEVQALGGTVDVQSTFQQGTRFTITLPADLGSCPILVVRCGEHQFGLPVVAVQSIVAARRDRIRASRLEHQDELLPLRDLGNLMGLREPELPSDGQPVLIVQSQGHRAALAVDEVIGDREQAVHPLPSELRAIASTYQGASTQGSGELLLVLRADWLVQFSQEVAAVKPSTRRVLVVDDSVTARAMHRAVLEAGGYTVHTVGSALGALQQLRHSAYDVIVCDVTMDDMDGVALTKQLRDQPETRSLPIMLVSTSDTEAERARGFAAGADGFLSKKDCAAGRLLSEITSVVSRKQSGSP